eukprot:527227-Rhodomonas_salina.3
MGGDSELEPRRRWGARGEEPESEPRRFTFKLAELERGEPEAGPRGERAVPRVLPRPVSARIVFISACQCTCGRVSTVTWNGAGSTQ